MVKNNDSDVLQEGNTTKEEDLVWSGVPSTWDENYSSTKSIEIKYAGTSQEGDENNAYIDQEGDGNVVNGVNFGIRQIGNVNDASVQQVGDENFATTFQTGDDNQFLTTQNGNENRATVVSRWK
jgi:hypothetical protein